MKKHSIIWVGSDGTDYPIEEMEIRHLQNTICFLDKKQKHLDELRIGDYMINNLSAKEWIKLFKDQLIKLNVIQSDTNFKTYV